jgi:hypothetical protein
MRAKSEIIRELSASLTSDIWKKLQTSLLGRELLALGGEIISESENVKDTLLFQLNPETANKYGLYLLSQMNEIPITNVKPNTVEVLMKNDSKSYAPYTLSYNVGNASFVNIEYTMHDKTANFVCGTHKYYYRNGASLNNNDGEETYFFDGEYSYSGIKLGNAYPDSITITDKDGLEIQRYSPEVALSDNIDLMYKVVTGLDGVIYVRFICAEDVESPSVFNIDWLDHSVKDVDIEDRDVKDNGTVVGTVEYHSKGSTDDLTYMRSQLKKGMAVSSGLNTPVMIEQYVNGFPFVIDSKCKVDTKEGGLCVYVKPASISDLSTYLDFSEIAAHIAFNTILFPKIKVRTGDILKFDIEISGVTSELYKNEIRTLIQDEFAEEKMKFDTNVNISNILNLIYMKYNILPEISMSLTEKFSNGEVLSGIPISGTLQGFDADNNISVWEDKNIMYGTSQDTCVPFGILDVAGASGTMFILKQSPRDENADDDADMIYKLEQTDHNGTLVFTPMTEEVGGVTQKIETDSLYRSRETSNITDKKSRFYLYDASTDTIKSFDEDLKNLINRTENPSILNTAWHSATQDFKNLYDMDVISTNDSAVFNFRFTSKGVQGTKISGGTSSESDEFYTLTYWNDKNLDNFAYFRDGNKKYQMAIAADTSLSLMNINTNGWNYYDTLDGNDEKVKGFSVGLCGKDDYGADVDINSSAFIYENQFYYISGLNSDFVSIHNNKTGNDFGVQLSSVIRGLIVVDDRLYVVQKNNVTIVDGFSGIKQHSYIYNIYLNVNRQMEITEITKGFNDYILIKSVNENGEDAYYVATGFEFLSETKLGFKNLKEVFTDVEDKADFRIGSCNGEYATLYKEVNNSSQNGFVFCCCNLTTGESKVYNKIATLTEETEITNLTDDLVFSEKIIQPFVEKYAKKEAGDLYGDEVSNYENETLSSNGTFYYHINNKTYTHRVNDNGAVMAVYDIVWDNNEVNKQVGDIILYMSSRGSLIKYKETAVRMNTKIGVYDKISNTLKLDIVNNVSTVKYKSINVHKSDKTYMVLNDIRFID